MGCGSSSQSTQVVSFQEPAATPEASVKQPKPSPQQNSKPEEKPKEEETEKSYNTPPPPYEPVALQTESNVDNSKSDEYTPVSYLSSTDGVSSNKTDSLLKMTEKIEARKISVKNIDYNRELCHISSDTKPNTPPNKLTIIHFNDVYNIESRDQEPVGGAARFVTKVRSFPDDPIILFSGDCLNPSLMSSVTKGKQMLPVMNALNIHAAVYGNHDFDFGVDELIEFKKRTNFPWLMSNVKDKLTKTLLADGVEKIVCDWYGRKIGIIGVVEQEWLVTLATIDPEDVEYIDFVECSRDLVKELKENQGCEFIIALTHMRVPNDLRLLESDVGIDLILGGHDHHYETQERNGNFLVKSGTDFRELSEITINFSTDDNSREITTQRHEITKDVEEDEQMKQECDKYSVILGEKMEEDLGYMKVDLDGRFSTVRTKESNLGNFICDIMRAATQTDIAILNSGSLRSDTIHNAGPFKMRDLVSILPMVDSLVVLSVTGKTILEVLENSVCQYPKFEGRFLQVSGLSFVFDPEKPPGERVLKDTVMVYDRIPISLEQEYTVVTKEYLSRGKDGFDMLTSCKVLVDAENGPILMAIIENHFESIRIYTGRRKSISGHRQSLTVKRDEVQAFMEEHRSKLAPTVEGRIRLVGQPEVLSPVYLKRKSKLRLRSSESVDGVPENTQQQITEPLLEEVEIESDSDIDSIMESDATREAINEENQMNLWEACRVDDIEKVQEIVGDKTFDFKFWIMEKCLLHHTAQHNSVKCLEYLMKETNLKVNVRDQVLKGTALFYAAEHGSKEAAMLLIDNGACVNAKNILWETPLHVACENEQGEIIIVLLNRGADRTAKNKEGEKPKI